MTNLPRIGEFPISEIGDLLVIHDTGAHGYSMGYQYNAKLRSAEILLEESGQARLIRRAENQRITLQHCMALTLKNRAFWYNRKCVNIEFRRKTLMSTFLTILLIILAFFGGMLAGMYLLRKQFEKEFASNPRLNVEAVRTLLGASGQRPSEAKGTTSLPSNFEPTKASLNTKKK